MHKNIDLFLLIFVIFGNCHKKNQDPLLLPLVDNSSSGTSDNANGAEIVMILAEATVRVTIMVVQELVVITVPVSIW